MIKLAFDIGYTACEFSFEKIEEAVAFAEVALDRYIPRKDHENLVIELKKCAGSGNSEMAHDNKSF